MAAPKKITEQIAEDMRERYGKGETTQAELASLFNVSIPTVNKTVKGIKSPKRGYKRNAAKAKRNEEIVSAYAPDDGVGMKELSEQFNLTYQNISIILQAAGISPRSNYFKKLGEGKVVRAAAMASQKELKKAQRQEKVEKLSALWCSGCSVEEFRVVAALKSVNAAQVKIVLLRKKHGEELFPRRSSRNRLSADEMEAKVGTLSALYIDNPKNTEEMAAVFGEKESSLSRRICMLRKDLADGEELFPRQRKRKEVVEAGESIELVSISNDLESFCSKEMLEETIEAPAALVCLEEDMDFVASALD